MLLECLQKWSLSFCLKSKYKNKTNHISNQNQKKNENDFVANKEEACRNQKNNYFKRKPIQKHTFCFLVEKNN